MVNRTTLIDPATGKVDRELVSASDYATLEAERDRLRNAIWNAPHGDNCSRTVCDCWKRDALTEV